MKRLTHTVITLLTLALMASALAGCGTKTVDLMQYVELEYSGLDGNGRLTASFSQGMESFPEELLGEMPSDLSKQLDYLSQASDMLDTIEEISAQPEEGLSNGDTVTVTIQYDEQAAAELGFQLESTSQEFLVSGLEEGTTVDLFQDLEVNFVGISPYGRVDLLNNATDDFFGRVSYTAEPAENLKNGDTVTVTAQYSETAAEQKLYLVNETVKTYTVEGLDSYLSDAEQLDEEAVLAMDQDARDYLEARFAARDAELIGGLTGGFSYDVEGTIAPPTLATAYLLNSKGADFGGNYGNLLVLVYQTELDIQNNAYSSSWENYTGGGYFPVAYTDLVITGDGSVEVNLPGRLVGGQAKRLDDAYTYWVTSNKDKYTIQELSPEDLGLAGTASPAGENS